jgi:hypothetical protein
LVKFARVAMVDFAAGAFGVGLGLWVSWMSYSPCRPHQLCVGFQVQYFAAWQASLIGGAALMVILVLGAAVSTDFRRANLSAARRVRLSLFEDLSRTTLASRSSGE